MNKYLAPTENFCDKVMAIHSLFFEKEKTRKDILWMEKWIARMNTSFDECPYPIFHSFANGMYTREMHINGGDLIVGKIHKNDYFVKMLTGRAWVVSEFGAKELIAPCSFVAKAGVKHIGFHLEDTVWTDVHKVSSENIEEAEVEIFADSYEELDTYNNIISNDFAEMCIDIGLSEEVVKELSEDISDLIDQPSDDSIEVKESSIDGLGVFSLKPIKAGERIAIGRIGDKRTQAGRYVNHSDLPNAKPIIEEDMGIFVALVDINEGDEITADYRDVKHKSNELDGVILCQAG